MLYREESAWRLLKSDALSALTQLSDWKLNIGAPGSGIHNLMNHMLDANHLAAPAVTLLEQPAAAAVAALLAGESDALALISAHESAAVQTLLRTPNIRLLDFAQSAKPVRGALPS